MTSKGTIVVAAGGTGGHLFAAQALAEVLIARGHTVHLMTDERGLDYGKAFPAEEIHLINSASPSLSKPLLIPRNAFRLGMGLLAARRILKRLKPSVVVGFGGYPSYPPLLAAKGLNIPIVLHEQNAVLGRANKALAKHAAAIGTSFANTIGLPEGVRSVLVGNPARAIALKRKASPYPDPRPYGEFPLVIFGGSQGARFFSEFMPLAFAALPENFRKRLVVTQQCRTEDMGPVRAAYTRLEVKAELAPFFTDMPRLMAEAMLVICRSGASSISELGIIGRPAVLVPLPGAIDNDQLRNAQGFAKAGAGWVFPQGELKPAEFAAFLSRLMGKGTELRLAADAALSQGRPEAAQDLANLVEFIAAQPQLGDKQK